MKHTMKMIRLLLIAALAAAATWAQALTVAPYSEKALSAAQNAGQPVALHFHASWCPTCRAQDKAFEALKADPALNLTVLQADYDDERELKRALNIRTQATLIVYHGKEERTRVIGETAPDKLKAALQTAF